jgi:hypothetical protein
MEEQVTTVPEPVFDLGSRAARDAARPPEPLEQRVQRLEDAVAALQDTQHIEDRVAERVHARLQGLAVAAPAPLAGSAAAGQGGDTARYTAAAPNPAPPPVTPVLPTPPAPWPRLVRRSWLLIDLAAELRAMVRMFFDIHYHVGWTTRLIVFVLVPVILLSHWWFPLAWVPLVGRYVDKVLDLFLAFFVYKALSREAQRYLETRGGRR